MKIRLLAVAAMTSATLTAPNIAYAYDDEYAPDPVDPAPASSPQSGGGVDDGYVDDYDDGYVDDYEYDPYEGEDPYDDYDDAEATDDDEDEAEEDAAEEPAPGAPCTADEYGTTVAYEDTELTCVQDELGEYFWADADEADGVEDEDEDEDTSPETLPGDPCHEGDLTVPYGSGTYLECVQDEDGDYYWTEVTEENLTAPAPGAPCDEVGATHPYGDDTLECVPGYNGSSWTLPIDVEEPEPVPGDEHKAPDCTINIVGEVHIEGDVTLICVNIHTSVYNWYIYNTHNWIFYGGHWYWWNGHYWCWYYDEYWYEVHDTDLVTSVEHVQTKTSTPYQPVSYHATDGGSLPVTGTALSGLVAVALLLTGVGAALWYLSRRRSGTTPVG